MLRRMAMRQPVLFTPLLTSQQAADQLGRDKATVVRWVQQGHLSPAMTCSCGGYLFDPAEVARAGAARWKGKRAVGRAGSRRAAA